MKSGSGGWWMLWKQQKMVMGVEKDDEKHEEEWLRCQEGGKNIRMDDTIKKFTNPKWLYTICSLQGVLRP